MPLPRVVAGAPAQADFTLLAVTLVPQNGSLTPPTSLAPPVGIPEPSIVARNHFVLGAAGATGLWIGVRGGIGVKTITIPQDGLRHAYPFGRFFLVSKSLPSVSGGPSSSSIGWEGAGGMSLFDMGAQPPYEMSFSGGFIMPGHPRVQTVTLTPSPFSGRFRVTAQPLSADGRPTGRAVGLLCQPVTANALFAEIPVGYSAATRQFRVTVARAGAKTKAGGAAWRIADVPPSTEEGTAGLPPVVAARVGPFALHAVAAEAEDTSGSTDPANPRPNRIGGPLPENMDQHPWTGVPTVRYLLTARAASPPVPGESWLFQIDRAMPQWSAPPPMPMASGDRPLGLVPLTRSYVPPGSEDWVLQDGEVGAAYPGQQHWIKIDGTALRSSQRSETLTFHNVEVVHDAGFGGDRLVWRHPETVTTPSGIAVTVLNGRPGKRETSDARPFGQDWWYDRGNAELLLAWRLPPGVISGQHAALNAPRMAEPPHGGGPHGALPLLASWDNTRPDPYAGATAPPGGVDARPLTRAGYSLLRLSVWAPQTPKRTLLTPPSLAPGRPARPVRLLNSEDLPPYSWREGSFVLTATPLPRHLPKITLQITLREEQERRPVHLVVPVWPSLPPGADPNAPKPVPAPRTETRRAR